MDIKIPPSAGLWQGSLLSRLLTLYQAEKKQAQTDQNRKTGKLAGQATDGEIDEEGVDGTGNDEDQKADLPEVHLNLRRGVFKDLASLSPPKMPTQVRAISAFENLDKFS